MPTNVETTANVAIAGLLRNKNPRWREAGAVGAEQAGTLANSAARPDIIVCGSAGAPVIIETEFMPARTVEGEAASRIGAKTSNGRLPIEQAVALRIPKRLRDVPQENLDSELGSCEFTYCVYSSTGNDHVPVRWPTTGWLDGDMDALVDLVDCLAISERLLAGSIDTLEEGIKQTASILQREIVHKPDVGRRIAEALFQQEGEQTRRMAMAILANALTFQTMLSGNHGIRKASEIRDELGNIRVKGVLDEWQRIIHDINYWPIFDIAHKILLPIPTSIGSEILERLQQSSDTLAATGVTRSHDLTGRMFQRMIGDRKFLATFYTRPTSSALLAHMAAKMLRIDWSNSKAVVGLQVADLACGTGTLLVAAYHAIASRHCRAGGDDHAIHKDMIEKTLIAADIMPAAAHLTASMLSSVHPNLVYEQTRVYTLPFGEPREPEDRQKGLAIGLGSLDLLQKDLMTGLFGTGIEAMKGKDPAGKTAYFSLPHDSLDLAIMNPPFTSPTNHKMADIPVPSFGGFGTGENIQKLMSEQLKRYRSDLECPAGHGNAGLASNFIDLAHVKLKKGGVLALVLPQALVQGNAWQGARNLLDRWYEDIAIVTLASMSGHEASFSADTDMGEVLLVARKRNQIGSPKGVCFVNLRKRPASIAEAVEIARRINRCPVSGQVHALSTGGSDVGQMLRAPIHEGGCAGVVDAEVARTAMSLKKGDLIMSRMASAVPVPMIALGQLGSVGPLHRDITGIHGFADSEGAKPRGPFDLYDPDPAEQVSYPVLWGHDAKKERQFVLLPDKAARVRDGMQDKALKIWNQASHLHYPLEFSLSAQPFAAAWTENKTIGGRAWPNFVLNNSKFDKTLLLWANTTLGILLFWWLGNRQHPGRAMITISTLPSLYVIDVTKLKADQFRKVDKIFDRFASINFLPANEAYRDQARKELDRAVLSELLGLPNDVLENLSLLRKKWCAEPSVHGGKSTRIR